MKTLIIIWMCTAMFCLITNLNSQSTNVMIKQDGIKVDDSNSLNRFSYLKSHGLDFKSTNSNEFAIYSKDSMYLFTDFSLLPLYSRMRPGILEMESVLTKSKLDSYSVKIEETQGDRVSEILPGCITLDSLNCSAHFTFNKIKYDGTHPFPIGSILTKDSLAFYRKPSIPLFESYSILDSDHLGFMHAADETYLDSRTFFMTDANNQAYYSAQGIENEEILSPSDIFTRFSLKPDSLTMFNGAKWQTVYLGTDPVGQGGLLDLYHTTGEKHTSIFGNGIGNSFMEMYHRDSLRILLANFSEYGIINTFGENGNMNTFMGKANTHGNADFGGMGVMDDIGFVRAGMDVDQSKNGVVYADGRFEIVDHNHHQWSVSDEQGYALRDQGGNLVISLNRDLIDERIGYVNTYGSNHNGNFFGGANFRFDGDGNGGLVEAVDANGDAQAIMFSNVNNEGVVHSDYVYVGCLDTFNLQYPLSVDQNPDFGMRLRKEKDNQFEFFIDGNGDLIIRYNGFKIGTFDKVSGSYAPISDIRLKDDISNLESVSKKVAELKPSRYHYINNNPDHKSSIGFIAQELQQVFPELVKVPASEEEAMTVDYMGISVIAIKALQEQQEVINSHQEEIDDLKSRLSRLEALMNK